MSLFSTLRKGLAHSIKRGLNGLTGRRHVFTFWDPARQSFPSSVAEIAALGWSNNVAAAWGCQDDSSSSTLTDFSGNGITLTKSGTTSRILTGQRAVGLNDGSSFVTQRALEFTGDAASNERCEAANGDYLSYDVLADSWSALVVFRVVDGVPTASESLFGKRGTGAPDTRGWSLLVTNSGAVILLAQGGTTQNSIQVAGNHADGAWHFAYARWDGATGKINLTTDLGTAAEGSITATVDSINTTPFGIGSNPSVNSALAAQIRGVIVWDDVATTPESIAAWWKHGSAPSWLTYSRASQFNSVVAHDSTGDVVASWGNGQVAYEYNGLISTNSRKLGLSSYVATTNLLTRTNVNHADWISVNATLTKYDKDSPRGFREAVKVVKTAINGRLRLSTNIPVTAGTTYTMSAWIWWDGADTAPVLYAQGTTSLTVYVNGGDGVVGDSRWHRVTATFTATSSENIIFDVYPSSTATATGTCWVALPMMNVGAYAQPWVFTNGATAATVAIAAHVNAPGLRTTRGTLKFWTVCAGQDIASGSRFVGSAVQASGSRSYAREMQINSSEAQSCQVFDSAGVAGATASLGVIADFSTAEGVTTMWWDQSEQNGWSLKTTRNEKMATTATDLPVDDVEIADICIGRAFATGSLQLDGAVSRVEAYDYVELAA